MDYQKAYQDKIGSAKLNIQKAVAGSIINCTLTYTVGKLGIDDSGSMKILFRIVTDCGNPQFENSQAENYVQVITSNRDVIVKPGLRSGGLVGKVHERPWSKGFTINFLGGFLAEGDRVIMTFKKWRMQTFYEKSFEFKVLVDPFATARYIELPHSPEIELIPGKPDKLVALTPTTINVGDTNEVLVKVEDKWGNPCRYEEGEITVLNDGSLLSAPQIVKMKQGRGLIPVKAISEGIDSISVVYKNMKAETNPVIISQKHNLHQFWADFHGQSEETVGTNDVFDYYAFARDYGFVQISCHQANDFQVTDEIWQRIQDASQKESREGKYIAFPGYEWSGNTNNGGDRNVIYKQVGEKIYRSSHALIEDFHDLKNDALTANELFKKLNPQKAVVFAHVGGRYAHLSMHDEKVEPCIEIHSDWGTFEWFLFDAFKRGYRVGIVANSDGHQGRPGASYPSFAHFNTIGGLTAVLAKKLTREAVFEALYNRHTYGTTGARIFLDVTLSDTEKQLGIMGDIIKNLKHPMLHVGYAGTAPVEKVEVYNGSKVIATHQAEIDKKQKKTIKVLWSGSKVEGRNRNFNWEGKVSVQGNEIRKLEKLYFFNKKNFVKHSKNSVEWSGSTTGGVQGFILTLAKRTGSLQFEVNGKILQVEIEKIHEKNVTVAMGGLDAKLQVYETHAHNNPHAGSFEYQVTGLKAGDNPLFVKVTQKDGHMAWSSPIYVVKMRNTPTTLSVNKKAKIQGIKEAGNGR